MSEEILSHIEAWESASEGVSEEAKAKIQEEIRQAKITAQQLKDDKTKNADFAKFLSFLINNIPNDELTKSLYDTFFITFNPKTGESLLRKTANTIVIVWFFYPFYQPEAKKYNLDQYFQQLLPAQNPLTIRQYMTYIQQLWSKYHDNIPIKQDSFTNFLIILAKTYLFSASDFPSLNEIIK